MRVMVLRSFCMGAGIDAVAGTIVECERYKAREWMALGFVCEVHQDEPIGHPDARQDQHPNVASKQVVAQLETPANREPRKKRSTI